MFDSSFIASLLPDRVQLAMARLHQAEAQQLLHTLGYLSDATDEAALLLATQTFRSELHAYAQADVTAWPRLIVELPFYLPQWDAEARLSTDETHILQQITSLEGDFVLGEWTMVLNDALCLRVLRHRLRSLGLPATDILGSLQALATHLQSTDLHHTAQLAGDIDALAQAVMAQADAGSPGLLFLRQENAREANGKMLLHDRGETFCSGLQARTSAQGYAAFNQEILGRIGHKQEAAALRDYLEAQRDLPLQGLQRHLLRLRLWFDGFLEVAPTPAGHAADLPEASWEAISQLLEFRKSSRAETDRDLLLVHVQDGVWALNAAYFWGEVCAAPDPQDRQSPLADLHALYADDADVTRLGIARADAPKLRTKLEDRLTAHADQVAGAENAPSARGGSARGVMRLLQWIRQQVDTFGEALDRLFAFVQGGTEGLFIALKRGFDTLGRCVEAIFHPPTIRSQTGADVITTTFGPGFAPVTKVDRLPSVEAMEQHTVQVMHFTSQCAEVMQLLGKVLQWGMALGTNPVSWVQVGLRIHQYASGVAQ
jgi:hypothetical protein